MTSSLEAEEIAKMSKTNCILNGHNVDKNTIRRLNNLAPNWIH